MDHLHAFLSAAVGGRLRILASGSHSPARPAAGNRSRRDRLGMRSPDGDARIDLAIANHTGPELEAAQSRFSRRENLHPLSSQHWTSLFRVIHRTAAASMVRAIARGRVILPTLRAIQRRLV